MAIMRKIGTTKKDPGFRLKLFGNRSYFRRVSDGYINYFKAVVGTAKYRSHRYR